MMAVMSKEKERSGPKAVLSNAGLVDLLNSSMMAAFHLVEKTHHA